MRSSSSTQPTPHRPPRRRSAALGLPLIGALVLGIAGAALPGTAALALPGIAPAPSTSAPTFEADYLDGVTGPDPAEAVDLAGTWDFTPLTNTVCAPTGSRPAVGPLSCVDTPASGEQTSIQVPGGGWLKQGWTDLSHAVYSRTIDVPRVAGDQVTLLDFGAINHKATVRVDGVEVGTRTTSFTSSVFDISDNVKAGGSHRIDVEVWGRNGLVGPDGRYTVPEAASWSNDIAQGIFRSATLEVYPSVYVSDTVVRTSVKERTLTYDVYVTNTSAVDQRVTLGGDLSSWNGEEWKYPNVQKQRAIVPAGETQVVTVGPLEWQAGADSYWEPNVPYQAGYQAQLHELEVDLKAQAQTTGRLADSVTRTSGSSYGVRFGFREIEQVGDHYELNGVRVNFRGDSLQGANYDSIDHFGKSDAFDTLPGFLKPAADNGGWPQAVDNYLRLNYSGVRIHQVPATPYMLDVADELGLMIQDETAIRGSNDRQNFITGRENMINHLADLVVRDRNHASVLRWSQANEPLVPFFRVPYVPAGSEGNPGAGKEFDEALYQTVMSLDATRPISTDSAGTSSKDDLPHANYTVFCHYVNFSWAKYSESICDGPAGKPQGQGEYIWWADNTPQGFAWFGTSAIRMREQGASDLRPYTLLDAWVSLIPGVKTTDVATEINYPNGGHPLYGEDNLPDPWSNHLIKLNQLAFNPVAVVDTDFWNENKMSDPEGNWPTTPSTLAPGTVTRTLTMFNDTFAGERVDLTWTLHRDSADGPAVASGVVNQDIGLGSHVQVPITFDVPSDADTLHLELTVSKPGQGTLLHDISTVYQVRLP